MKGTVVLKIWRGSSAPKPGVFNVNGWDYKVYVENIGGTDYAVLKELRTNTEITKVALSNVGVYPSGTPITISFASERPHPVFALENIEGTHNIVHTSWKPSPSDWVIEVAVYDTTAVISIPLS